MDWQVFRDSTESELAEHRAFVEQTLQWRVPDFHWSADSVKQWYENRGQWDPQIQEAVEFLYRYDYPLRVMEEQAVADESWLWQDYDAMRQRLMDMENSFWKQKAPLENSPDRPVPEAAGSAGQWWDTVRHRRGPRLAVLRSRVPLEKYMERLVAVALSNDYDAVPTTADADHVRLELIPQRFVDVLGAASPAVLQLLPMHMDFSRDEGRLSVTLTDWIGEAPWPEKPADGVLKALAWVDVTATIFLDSLGWVH